jgi:hypothetical protein
MRGGLYASIVWRERRALAASSLAIARGGGRRLESGDWATLMADIVEVMLEVERFLLCPLL